jgi:hypothetical protein
MDANGNTLVELGIELMKNLLVLFNLILLPLFGYGQNKYYGTFTGSGSGLTNLNPANISTNGSTSGQVLANLGNGTVGFTNGGGGTVYATNIVGTVPAANLPTLPYAALTKTNQADYYSGNSTGVSITNFNNLTVNNFTGSLMNGTLTNNLAGTYSISAYATIVGSNSSNPIYYLGVFTNGVLAGYADEDLSEYSMSLQSNQKLNIGTQLFQLPAGTGIRLKVWQAVAAPETYNFLFVNLSVQAH